MEEEQEAAEKRDKERTNQESKNTLGCSDVDTPRSESDLKQQSVNEEDQPSGAASLSAKDKRTPSPDSDQEEAKKLSSVSKESYGLDVMKFGNASVHGKHGTHSPMDR